MGRDVTDRVPGSPRTPRDETETGRGSDSSIRWRLWDTVALVGVTLAGGLLRWVGVGFPSEIVFDETYYAKDACLYVESSSSVCGIASEQTAVHPPLGKWLLALGIRVLGYDSFGWRVAAVVAGTATIPLVYLLARRLLRSTPAATFAAGLFAVDFLHITQSRIAMLDVFVPLFGTAATLFVVHDRDRLARDGAKRASILDRPWRLAAGAAAGAAMTTKWSGVLVVVLVLVLTAGWEISARRRASSSTVMRAVFRTFTEEGASILAWLVVVPALIYVATYIGRLEGSMLAWPWADDSWFRAFWTTQRAAADFHIGLEARHAYESPPWSWLLLKRPVLYYFDGIAGGRVRDIFATGNPLVWWTSGLAMAWVGGAWLRRHDLARPEGVILAGFLVNYLPWLLLSRGRSAVFVFYLLPALPFLYLALGYAANRLGSSWQIRSAIAVFVTGSLVMLAMYYPLLTGRPVEERQWRERMLFEDCADKPRGTPSTSIVTETSGGRTTTREKVSLDNSSLPPKGWCWI